MVWQFRMLSLAGLALMVAVTATALGALLDAPARAEAKAAAAARTGRNPAAPIADAGAERACARSARRPVGGRFRRAAMTIGASFRQPSAGCNAD